MSAPTAAEPSQACLKWSEGTLPLTGPCVIGRRSDNDLPIRNVQVSRRHALIVNFNGDWWLNDLGSRNGVVVNGVRLTSARRLRHGDEIRIANHRMVFIGSNGQEPNHSSIAGPPTEVAVPDEDDSSPVPQAVSCELIISTLEGDILEGEKAAHWFFGETLERAPGAAHYRFPPSVRQWLARVVDGDMAPLEIPNGSGRMRMTLARRKEDRLFLLVREDSAQVSVERLRALDLNLTLREAEVMHWICEGKTNPEIVQIFDVTVHTVNRHVEHIFKKLGVDNRQKAIKVVTERLGA